MTAMDPAAWNRAKDILSEVLSLPPHEREAIVRERCKDDESLRDEILALLAQPDPDTSFLETPVTFDEPDEFADIVAGTDIGGYIVIDRLGRGGMGQVFLARDPKLHRRVALKCLLASASGADLERARILDEARKAAAIEDTTYVASVHHVVEHGDRLFIVMEYVRGETLGVKMQRERLPIERVIAIGRQLAAALQAAHAAGVIHRDIKPGNIQITMDGSVKVLDFGVARSRAARSSGSSSSTTVARRARASGPHLALTVPDGGTPPYMSPEQLRGEAADERSDIFSLGVVLFEMATGRRPFEGDSRSDILESQTKGAPRADAVDNQVPLGFADAIGQALTTSVRARWQTAVELRTALEALPSGPPRGRSSRELFFLWAARVLVGVPLVILSLAMLGEFKVFVFNNNFGRTGPFARFGVESWTSYIRWGRLGFGSKLLAATVTTVFVMAARIVVQGLELIAPVARAVGRVRTIAQRLALAIGLDRASILAQTVAGLGVLTLLGLSWHHAGLINAWMVSFNSAPIEMLMPMRESVPERGNYQAELSVVIFALCFGLFKVVQVRRRQQSREGWLAVVALAGVIAVAFLMNEAPFRSFEYRDFERADFADERCYVTGEYRDEVLILCPRSDPPRNRAVRGDDPRLRRLGVTENVFRGVNPSGSHP